MVHQILYVSNATKEVLCDVEIDKIVSTAQSFNIQADITGILLLRSGVFLQLLEGKKPIIESLFQKICHDKRHANIIQLFSIDSPKRVFPDWSMGFKKLGDLDIKMINEILSWNKLISNAGKIDEKLILQMLSRFNKVPQAV